MRRLFVGVFFVGKPGIRRDEDAALGPVAKSRMRNRRRDRLIGLSLSGDVARIGGNARGRQAKSYNSCAYVYEKLYALRDAFPYAHSSPFIYEQDGMTA